MCSPRRPLPDERLHWTFLIASAAVLLAAWVLVLVDEQRVGVGGTGFVLPGSCVSRYVFGMPCPGCGLTRSFVCLAHGDLARAWAFNPAGVLLFALIAIQIPFRGLQIWRLRQGQEELEAAWLGWAISAAAVALLVQWVVRIMFPGWFVF